MEMKFLLTVLREDEIVKQAVMEPGNALVSASLEVLEGNTISMRPWIHELYDYNQFNYDLRETRTMN